MLNFRQFLVEGRSHPELNPKVSTMDTLRKYKDDPDIFISFTKKDKIGVNPKSDFNTPIAVCTYPLKSCWIQYNLDNENAVRGKFPFASTNPYIYILRKKGNFIDDISKYSEEDYNRDVNKLKDLIMKGKDSGAIYRTKPGVSQEEVSKLIDKKGKEYAAKHFLFKIIKKSAEEDARVKIPFGKLWNLTRIMSSSPTIKEILGVKILDNNRIVWNFLFSKLGYDGAADYGKGILHPSEPFQAMFFSPKGYDLVERVENKETIKYTLWNEKTKKVYGAWTDKKILWIYGIFAGQIWDGGTWNNGIFESGVWEDGVWKKGLWKDGIWQGGVWFNGTWETGVWWDGIWKNGIWNNGSWSSGTWQNGTWKSGVWNFGDWDKGTWENGTWKNGEWYNGVWKDGTWLNGTWRDGTWTGGNIFSFKFYAIVYSKVNPKEFYKLEQESNTLQELKDKVKQ